ncbi:MAG: hypothetical protein Hals2KO_18460 [Halioglobus sp.]
MKRLDDDKVSLVDFMRSIKFKGGKQQDDAEAVSTHFAHFYPQARPAENTTDAEDHELVRSAN